jgi:Family of unknown function (DUF5994)
MATSPTTSPPAASARVPLRLGLSDTPSSDDGSGGSWWPQSRDLQTEAADLVDHFPEAAGHISRMLFSRPDWDNSTEGGRGVRRILADRGPVKVGSFPGDDTALMILSLASGDRLTLHVIPSDSDAADAEQRLSSVG